MAIKTVDALVIGAGPAGLAAACALRSKHMSVLLVDRGLDLAHREHDTAKHLGEGVGGAGLFSDGKFSFYPSGTQLYNLTNRDRLRTAYDWCCQHLTAVGIESIPFPEIATAPSSAGTSLKDYPSFYGSLNARRELIGSLARDTASPILTQTSLERIEQEGGGFRATLSHRGETLVVDAGRLVLAMGRFGSTCPALTALAAVRHLPMRFEFGIRIEALHEQTFLARQRAADVKRLIQIDELELRTFCTCRKGEVWNIPYGPYSALSGRSDGAPTSYSNFGFLVRFTGSRINDGREQWSRLSAKLQKIRGALYQPLFDFLEMKEQGDIRPTMRPWFPREDFSAGDLREPLGDQVADVLRRGIGSLVEWAPELLHPSTACLFPALEGIGEFPDTDQELRLHPANIWCAGDMVGHMRGLIPGIVGGYYAGLGAAA